jgi:hypothetical protein
MGEDAGGRLGAAAPREEVLFGASRLALLGALRYAIPAARKPSAYIPCTPVRRMRLTLRAFYDAAS